MPPRAVMMPSDTAMPSISSGRSPDGREHAFESGLVCLCSSVSGEVNRAAGCAGRCRQAGGDRRSCLERCRIERRMQQCIELLRLYLHNRLLLVQTPSSTEVNCDLERCLSGTLAVTGLEHIELAVLDGELHILHIAVVLFEAAGNVNELIDKPPAWYLPARRSAAACGCLLRRPRPVRSSGIRRTASSRRLPDCG